MDKTNIHFVGAGPGAEDLITVRGMRLISGADLIIYTGSLVNRGLLGYAREDCRILDSSGMVLEDIVEEMRAAAEKGLSVVRLHTGEPSIYGAVREQMDELDGLGIGYDSTPGVSACFGAAASLDLEYTLPGVSQTLIITRMEGRTPVPESESIESLAAHRTSMAIYLSAGMMEELQRRLESGYDESTPAAVVFKATWEEELALRCTVGTLAQTALDHGIDRTAVVLVGDAVSGSGYENSKLYDRHFTTGYREADR